MMTEPLTHLVVMAGGSGTRFWPKSTSSRPKQLLAFSPGGPTLLHATLERFSDWIPAERQWILTTEKLAATVRDQHSGVGILAEPQGRNTAPCLYWAARHFEAQDPNAVMLVMPADHFIADPVAFTQTVKQAVAWAAEHDDLVTLGIRPTRPETGYGYLRIAGTGAGALRVEAFVEKPNLERAEQFLRDGRHLWNGGMFAWRVSTLIQAFDQHMPEMTAAWKAARQDAKLAYSQFTATSIDFGVMEKAKNVVTFALDCGWDDVGSWTSLESLADSLGIRGPGGVISQGSVVALESGGNIVDAPGRLVALLDVKDLVIVEQGPVLLVTRKARAQDVKLLVEAVKKERPELA